MKKSTIATIAVFVACLGPIAGFEARAQTSDNSKSTSAKKDDLDDILSSPNDAAAPSAASPAPSPQSSPQAKPYASLPVVRLNDSGKAAAATPAVAEKRRIEEIVVTARRTAENLQDVPVAISALGSGDLERERINSPQDLQGRVPSLVITSGSQMRNTEAPTIRGQGSQFGAPPGVVVYFAEVPLPSDPVANNQGGPGKFFDLSNLQILKGSQGTLFGRNTTGGALLLEPKKPTDSVSGSVGAGASTLGGRSLEGVYNTPLVGDTLLMRAGVQFFERGGFTKDVLTGKNYDDKHYIASRLGMTWRQSDAAEHYVFGYYSDSKDNGTAVVIERINREGLNEAIPGALGAGQLPLLLPAPANQAGPGCQALNIFGPSTNCGQDILDEQQARGVRRVQQSADANDILHAGGVSYNFKYDLGNDLAIRNIASYSRFKHHYRWDLDGSRAKFNDFRNADDVEESNLRTYTNELQLQGSVLEGSLKFTAGGYYEGTDAIGAIDADSLLFVEVHQNYKQTKRSYAPFAQGTLDLGAISPALSSVNLTIGGRYTFDRTTGFAALRQAAVGALPIVDTSHVAEAKSAAPTFTIGLDYVPFEATLLYGKVSSGYKTGGLSTIAVNPDHFTYKPEYVTNYEIGQKSDLLIGEVPLRINTSLYYTDYTNLQKAGTDSYVPPGEPSPVPQNGQAIFNVGAAYVAGFEFEGTVQPLQGLTMVANYARTEAKHTKYTLLYAGATKQLDCTGQQRQNGDVLQLKCVPYQNVPKNQASISTRYLLPLTNSAGDVEASLTYAWTDTVYSAQTTLPNDEPGSYLPSFGLLNASLRWSNILGSSFGIQAYGTNLTNKLYRISNSNQWHLTYFQASIYSEPRIVGMQLNYQFGQN